MCIWHILSFFSSRRPIFVFVSGLNKFLSMHIDLSGWLLIFGANCISSVLCPVILLLCAFIAILILSDVIRCAISTARLIPIGASIALGSILSLRRSCFSKLERTFYLKLKFILPRFFEFILLVIFIVTFSHPIWLIFFNYLRIIIQKS